MLGIWQKTEQHFQKDLINFAGSHDLYIETYLAVYCIKFSLLSLVLPKKLLKISKQVCTQARMIFDVKMLSPERYAFIFLKFRVQYYEICDKNKDFKQGKKQHLPLSKIICKLKIGPWHVVLNKNATFEDNNIHTYKVISGKVTPPHFYYGHNTGDDANQRRK